MTAMAEAARPFPASADGQFGGDQRSPFPSLRRRRFILNPVTGKVRVSVTRDKDNEEFFAMMRRMIRAAEKRVKAEDPSTLAGLSALQEQLDHAIGRAAIHLYEQGWSWGEIGHEFGIGRHAARKRWGR